MIVEGRASGNEGAKAVWKERSEYRGNNAGRCCETTHDCFVPAKAALDRRREKGKVENEEEETRELDESSRMIWNVGDSSEIVCLKVSKKVVA